MHTDSSETSRLWIVVALALACAPLFACQPNDAPDRRTDARTQCTEGRVVGCPCPDGTTGRQTCRADGTFGPCQCEGDAAAGDAADTSRDVPSPTVDAGDAHSADTTTDTSTPSTDASSGDDATSEDSGPSDGSGAPTTDDSFLHEGWEHGNLGIIEPDQPYDGVPDPYWDEAVVPTQEYARAGDWSHKIHIDSDWDFSDVNSYRVNPRPGHDVESTLADRNWSTWNVPFWFSFSFFVPPDWEPDSMREQLFEFHRDLSENPGASDGNWDRAACDYTGFCLGDGKPLSMLVDGRQLTFTNDYSDADGTEHRDRDISPPGELEPGTWYDVVLHIKWSKEGDGETGFMRIWVNDEKIYDHTGNTAAPDDEPPRDPKWGVYKWRWDHEDIDQPTRTYYFDEFRYGDGDATYEGMRPGER